VSEVEKLVSHYVSPHEAFLETEALDRLKKLSAKLPRELRPIVPLWLEGNGIREIARILHVHPNRVQHVIDWLKKKIEE